jgi:hypothetical protein
VKIVITLGVPVVATRTQTHEARFIQVERDAAGSLLVTLYGDDLKATGGVMHVAGAWKGYEVSGLSEMHDEDWAKIQKAANPEAPEPRYRR